MTDDQITELESLAKAASNTPWTVDIESDCQVNVSITIPEINRRLHDCDWADEDEWDRDYKNSAFIVAACNSANALCAEVRRLRKVVDAAANYVAAVNSGNGKVESGTTVDLFDAVAALAAKGAGR